MSPTRVLALGIDGASPQLLLRWSGEGMLPNLASLIARGRVGQTDGIAGFFVGSTWPSIHTGLSPARHGFHYQLQLKPGSYDFYHTADQGLFHGQPFWQALSEAGRRVAVLDAPLCPINHSLNGIQIVEWGGHDEIYGFLTQPASLAESIHKRYGRHPAGVKCDAIRSSASDYESFVQTLERGVDTKTQLTIDLLREGKWDFFMQVFSEAHCAGHQCWHLHDTSHPGHDAAIANTVGDPIQRVYQSIDAAIGQLLDVAGDSLIFVFSSHGMSHWYGAQFLLNEILFRLGVAQRRVTDGPPATVGSLVVSAGSWLWHQLPAPLRHQLRGLRQRFGPNESNGASMQALDVDVTRSQCFHHRHGLALGGLRLNLVGREPHGVIAPGREANALCRTLTEDLLAIVDERTGRPLISRVLRVADLYQGPHLAELPDLIVDYADEIATGSAHVNGGRGAAVRVTSPKIGVVEGINTYGRTGEHRAQGLLIAAGPGITPGALPQPISVMDLAPTWTQALGVELTDVDGTAIEGLPVAG